MSIQQNEIKILDQLLLVDLSGIHLPRCQDSCRLSDFS